MAEPASWDDFADAPDEAQDDPWAAFEDAPRSKAQRRRDRQRAKRSEAAATPAPASVISGPVTPHDGDTLDLGPSNALRLWGIDAPELNQLGWDRAGQPVPIGRQSLNALSGIVGSGTPALGPVVGQSYGRAVAPLTVDGIDAGRTQVRSGNALAAPDFLSADPERRFDYMQAERLARLNRQGLHQTFNQAPQDFRRDPVASPDRETVAQFWDTPTPDAGMRPEDEAKYVELLRTSNSVDEIVNFARGAGRLIDPADVSKWLKDRAEWKAKGRGELPAYANYVDAAPVMTDPGDGAAGAGARGLANGVLPSLLEETGAVVDSLGGTNGRENIFNSDRRWADIWANNAAQNEAITRFDRFEHPYVTTGAEIAGGLAVPIGRVRTAADLAKFGAGFGALSGLGREGSLPERLSSGVVGAGEGLALTVLGGKALEAAAERAPGALRWAGDKLGMRRPGDGAAASDAIPTDGPRVPDRIDTSAPPSAPARTADRIDVGRGAAPMPDSAAPPLDTAYPGPVAGKAPSISDITPEVEAWAQRQGIGGNMMLHGSKTPDIEAFDPYAKSGYGLFGQGTYLTDNAGVALGYTGKGLRGTDQSGRTIYSVEQSVKNPLDLDAPADLAKWSALAERHGLDLPEGATNEQAYRALEEAVAEDMVPKWEGAEIMSDAVRSMGHDGLTHIGGGRRGKADAPRHRVMIALDPEQTAIRGQLSVGDMLKPPMRDREWIDIGQVPGARVPDRIEAGAPRSMAMDAEPAPSITQDMPSQPGGAAPLDRPQPISQPLSDAQRQAMAADVTPADVVPIKSNEVGSIEEAAGIEAGRYAPAKPVDETTALESRTVTSQNGRELPKRGPLDLVTWLRTQGGIKDQGGNLRSMGIDNSPRDLDFARGEQRFGRLIDDDAGMNLDDAAHRAWEAGYLPGSERPDINAFLDAIDRTHSGAERFYHPDDLAEVAKFDGMRADRRQLEEQLADGPVHVDRSAPAEEPQPFPPPEAYEDWPAGGPDFAGNIDLRKLDTPRDIKRALDFSERRVGGFDAATRGRVSQAETERLASELGMTPETLLSRRKGQSLNAEEALAARQILAKSGNELVNMAKRVQGLEDPGDELLSQFRQAWMRHVAIQEQVAGMTAEAGRALAQFKMTANSRAVRGDVLSAIARGGGGRDGLKDAADVLIDAVEAGPGVFNPVAKKAMNPKWRNRLSEIYINFLLSNPATHVVNMTSNLMTAMAQIPEHALAGGIGRAREVFARNPTDRIVASEVGARAFGLLQGAREGAAMFARALKTGEPADLVSKVEGQEYKAVPGKLGELVRMPTRFLTAEDELFKGIARRMELSGLAVRIAHREGLKGKAAEARISDLLADPTDAMLARADDYARYLTFQAKLGPFGSKLSAIANDNLAAKVTLPFVRTPMNLLKFAAERSPYAPFMKEWRAQFAKGGADRDLAVAKALVGTGFGYAMYQGAASGMITGSAPSDPKKARLLYADGWKPYSIKLGDTYYSYKRLDPFSTTLGVAADLATLPDGMSKRQQDDGFMLLVASIMGNLANKTWMSGVSNVVGALHDPERNADNMLQRLVGAFLVPAGVGGLARTIDPTSRQVDSFGDAVQSRVPGLSSTLLPRRDIWGDEIKSEGGLGPDFLSPVAVSTALNDPVNKALLQLDYAPGYPSKKVGGEELNPKEYDRYSERAGKLSHSGLNDLVTSPEWKAMDDEAKVDAARKVVSAARKQARGELFAGKPSVDDDEDGGAPAAATDPWAVFKDAPGRSGKGQPSPPANDEWTQFKDPPQRDVIGNLMTIPGLTRNSLTSGYRTPEYQADMRRRGYKPSSNSGHLDGSSLDIVVPAGKTMRWLMGQVKRAEPNALLLPEGDHLHATFPDWYSAPAIGGARSAGLRNPMAGQ